MINTIGKKIVLSIVAVLFVSFIEKIQNIVKKAQNSAKSVENRDNDTNDNASILLNSTEARKAQAKESYAISKSISDELGICRSGQRD